MGVDRGQRIPNRRGEGGRLRHDLVSAALELVDGSGPSAVSLRAVARAAGVAAPSIYRHFAHLDALMDEVVGRCFEDLGEEICTERDRQQNPVDQLLGCCRGYLQYANRVPKRYALLFAPPPGPTRGDGEQHDPAQQSLRVFRLLVDAITRCLDIATTPGQAHVLATTIWVGLDGFANLRAQRPGFPWPDTETMLQHLVLDHIRSR